MQSSSPAAAGLTASASRWDDVEAARHTSDLALRAYSSRLLGTDPALVLHGGGNTSVKTVATTVYGDEDVLWIKGSGHDLATIREDGFAPVRLARLRALAGLESLSDLEMANELRTSLLDAAAPEPSVEAILHAILPWRFVDHTHAEAFLAISDTRGGDDAVGALYADADVVVVPYAMPGFALARLCAERFAAEATADTIGIVLLRHGLVSFADDARTSYERMLELVARAETFLEPRRRRSGDGPPAHAAAGSLALPLAELRARISGIAGRPLVMTRRESDETLAFAAREDLADLAERGPFTPDHVIRTKRLPLVGRDVNAYAESYQRYFRDHGDETLTMLDPAPRVVLDEELGLCALGTTAGAADIAADIYERTIGVILAATDVDAYEPLPAADVFAVEYWSLEQAKLHRAGPPLELTGDVALVTGAASGIGRACVDALLRRGAAVVGVDIDARVERQEGGAAFLGVGCDVTSDSEVAAAVERGVRRFGGIDIVVLNAGIFPRTQALKDLEPDEWRRTMAVNLDAAALVLRDAYPFLALAPRGGRVAVVGSKNVVAPGPGAAAYSASKAALTQLARVAALEWGTDGIRVNVVHPNAVFDTGIWTDDVLAERAASYGITVDEYRRKTLLGVEVTSRDVAEVVAGLCGPMFSRTTGAQIPVDGGNERVV